MTTAQRILESHKSDTFAQAQAMQREIRDLAIETQGHNCYDRTWTFWDGSKITMTRDGFKVAQ